MGFRTQQIMKAQVEADVPFPGFVLTAHFVKINGFPSIVAINLFFFDISFCSTQLSQIDQCYLTRSCTSYSFYIYQRIESISVLLRLDLVDVFLYLSLAKIRYT